jgi:hypothetical protein
VIELEVVGSAINDYLDERHKNTEEGNRANSRGTVGNIIRSCNPVEDYGLSSFGSVEPQHFSEVEIFILDLGIPESPPSETQSISPIRIRT